MSKTCPFCTLNTERERIIYSDVDVHVILSNPRLLPGHTLVMPKRHIEHPDDLTDVELLAIFRQISRVRSALLATVAEGVDIRQNYRPFLPQGRTKIDHVHFHVIPRTNEDDLYKTSMKFEHELFTDLNDVERDRFVDILTRK